MASKKMKQTLVWACILALVGILRLVEANAALSHWVWVAVLAGAGACTFGIYLTDRADWSLLLPPYVMWAVALLMALSRLAVLEGPQVAVFLLLAVAVPFGALYVRYRARRHAIWALFQVYVLLAVALLVVLVTRDAVPGEVIAAFVLTMIAVPFVVLFLRNRGRRWAPWALLPAYALAAIVLNIGLQAARIMTPGHNVAYALFAATLPFTILAVIGPRRLWLVVPAALLAAAGLYVLMFDEASGYVVPAILVLLGVGVAAVLIGQARRGPNVSEPVARAGRAR